MRKTLHFAYEKNFALPLGPPQGISVYLSICFLVPVSRKSRLLFGPEKLFYERKVYLKDSNFVVVLKAKQ